MADPGSRDADPRSTHVRSPPFSHAKGEGAPPSVPRIHRERRPDVAGPAHPRAAQEVPVVLCHLEQFLRRIGPAVDPMRTAGKGDVAVGIDHAGDDRRAAGIDDVDVGWEVALIRAGTNPDDVARVDENAYLFPERWPGRLSQSRVPIQGRPRSLHRTTWCVVRLNPGVQRWCRRTRPTAGVAGAAPRSRGTPRTPGRRPGPRGPRGPRGGGEGCSARCRPAARF